jgi:hypothetical protein
VRVAVGQLTAAGAGNSRVLQESQAEGCEHHDNADIHEKPFPEAILEEQDIDTDDNGYQYQDE